MMTLEPCSTVGAITDRRLDRSVDDLHRVCRVYTMPATVDRILDAVGWRADTDLSHQRLLEPAAGNGEFVVRAGRRLVASCRARGTELTIRQLRSRITAFELHPAAAAEARHRIRHALEETGVNGATAFACAHAWVRNEDFLLTDIPAPGPTHIVGNPPYARWSRIPAKLRATYEQRLPKRVVRGDLFLPFLERAFELLLPNGRCGFLCSDRWLYMAFAESFRQQWLPWLDILSNDSVSAADVFDRRVDAYPTILVASKRVTPKTPNPQLAASGTRTLQDMGYVIRCGPALGHTPAFVIPPNADVVEPELLSPWVDGPEIDEGSIHWRRRRVVNMFDDNGQLRDLRDFPRLERRLQEFRPQLSKRSIVQHGAPWYRTIDRVRAIDWLRPKLLVPELARTPRIAIDRSGAVPSHGVYAIFATSDDLDDLYEVLRDGGWQPRSTGSRLQSRATTHAVTSVFSQEYLSRLVHLAQHAADQVQVPLGIVRTLTLLTDLPYHDVNAIPISVYRRHHREKHLGPIARGNWKGWIAVRQPLRNTRPSGVASELPRQLNM